MPRKVRYAIASSLDGFISGPNGEIDWILMDPEIDFETIFAEYDTALMGSNTYQHMLDQGQSELPGMEIIVFSRTSPDRYPNVKVVSENAIDFVKEFKSKPGKDIWLFGGGKLFQFFAQAGVVDSVECAVIPVILGSGIPMCPPTESRIHLELESHRVFAKTGTTLLNYRVVQNVAK